LRCFSTFSEQEESKWDAFEASAAGLLWSRFTPAVSTCALAPCEEASSKDNLRVFVALSVVFIVKVLSMALIGFQGEMANAICNGNQSDSRCRQWLRDPTKGLFCGQFLTSANMANAMKNMVDNVLSFCRQNCFFGANLGL
jgi:hypothetical protein